MEDQQSSLVVGESYRRKLLVDLQILIAGEIRSPKKCWVMTDDEDRTSLSREVTYTPVLQLTPCTDSDCDQQSTLMNDVSGRRASKMLGVGMAKRPTQRRNSPKKCWVFKEDDIISQQGVTYTPVLKFSIGDHDDDDDDEEDFYVDDVDQRCATSETDAQRLSQQKMLYLFSKSLVKSHKMGFDLFNIEEEDQKKYKTPRTGAIKTFKKALTRTVNRNKQTKDFVVEDQTSAQKKKKLRIKKKLRRLFNSMKIHHGEESFYDESYNGSQ